jgi:uncharacterized protein YjiS (DUF1127 family)
LHHRDTFATELSIPELRRRFIDTMREWRHRAKSRRQLKTLSHLELKDLGRWAEYDAEKYKPFWKE